MLNPKRLTNYTKTAIKAATEAGKILKYYYEKGVKVKYKGKIDPVTKADKKSQETVLKILKNKFPTHSLVGEEGKNNLKNSEFCWIIDPLDGTVNFIHGVKVFSVSIGLSLNGEIISGVVYAPLLNEMYIAQKGLGSYLNGKRIQVSGIKSLVKSLVVTGFPYDVHSNSERVLKNFKNVLHQAQGMRRFGSASLDLCYLASGILEGYWEEGLKPWDVAAGSLIVTEAGGKITDYDGKNNFLWGGQLVASNGLVHKKLQKLITT